MRYGQIEPLRFIMILKTELAAKKRGRHKPPPTNIKRCNRLCSISSTQSGCCYLGINGSNNIIVEYSVVDEINRIPDQTLGVDSVVGIPAWIMNKQVGIECRAHSILPVGEGIYPCPVCKATTSTCSLLVEIRMGIKEMDTFASQSSFKGFQRSNILVLLILQFFSCQGIVSSMAGNTGSAGYSGNRTGDLCYVGELVFVCCGHMATDAGAVGAGSGSGSTSDLVMLEVAGVGIAKAGILIACSAE